MAAKKVGVLIKEARADAGLTQAQLAAKVDGVSASDISKVERGEKDLTQAQLKQVAKTLGVTQTSLLNAPKNVAASSSNKKPAAKTSGTSMKVTASEKKLVELYRAADSTTKKAAVNLLKGTKSDSDVSDFLNSMLSGFLGKTGSKSLPLLEDDDEFDFNEVVEPDDEEN